MKKVVFVIIFILILATSLVKNSTKEIEDKIFIIGENIRSINAELSNIKLEYNYLSSPEKLTKYHHKYFKDDLIKTDITKIKMIKTKNNDFEITSLIDQIKVDE